MIGIGADKQRLPTAARALRGRAETMPLSNVHDVHGRPLRAEFSGLSQVRFGMGCFWGAERKFWSLPGVFTTAVGYAGGFTPNATYSEVCSGETGHAEVVLVVYDEAVIGFGKLLRVFWENHNPTQGMRQGNDIGTQYRSVVHCTNQTQYATAISSKVEYQQRLHAAGHGTIHTEIVFPAPEFYYAEEEHQQYLSKHPSGYCGLGGTGVSCSTGLEA